MRFFTIGSGSEGNCAFLGSENTGILIDAGISGKRTLEGLSRGDISFGDLKGILITHEHRDHISCLGVLLRKHPIPVYSTKGTIEEILKAPFIGEVDRELFVPVKKDEPFNIGDLSIRAIGISHDARDPVAYRVEGEGKSFATVTDLGKYDDELISKLKGLSGILIEANHDLRMLETGIYPYHLKRRIAGEYGHLSNEDCGLMLSRLLHDDLNFVMLGHLSKENNYDKLARESVCLEISMADCPYSGSDFPLHIAHRKEKYKSLEF